jgi:hypothetical protein
VGTDQELLAALHLAFQLLEPAMDIHRENEAEVGAGACRVGGLWSTALARRRLTPPPDHPGQPAFGPAAAKHKLLPVNLCLFVVLSYGTSLKSFCLNINRTLACMCPAYQGLGG